MLLAMTQYGNYTAVRIEFTGHRERIQWSAAINIDHHISTLLYGLHILVCLARQWIQCRVTNGTRIARITTIAEEFARCLSTNARVLARIRITAIDHVTRIEYNFALATIFLFLPIGRQFVIAVNGNCSHTANETVFRFTATDEINAAGGNVEQAGRHHRPLIYVEHQIIPGMRKFERCTTIELEKVCFVPSNLPRNG